MKGVSLLVIAGRPRTLTQVWATAAPERVAEITASTTTRLLGLCPLIDGPDPFDARRRRLQVLRDIIVPFQEERWIAIRARRCGAIRRFLLLQLGQPARTVLARPPSLLRPARRRIGKHALGPLLVLLGEERRRIRKLWRLGGPDRGLLGAGLGGFPG